MSRLKAPSTKQNRVPGFVFVACGPVPGRPSSKMSRSVLVRDQSCRDYHSQTQTILLEIPSYDSVSNSLTKLIIGLYIVIEYLLGFASAYITCNYQITLPIVLCKVEFLIIITPGLVVGLR